jgi:hypothetical protein
MYFPHWLQKMQEAQSHSSALWWSWVEGSENADIYWEQDDGRFGAVSMTLDSGMLNVDTVS